MPHKSDSDIGRRLVLASASPRRRQLLEALDARFELAPVDIPEGATPGESPWNCARLLALAKLKAAVARSPARTALTADTVVDLDGKALGKPVSEEDAVEMLRSLRDRTHMVHTAVAVAGNASVAVCVCSTVVYVRDYSEDEMRAFIRTGEYADKAGAYAIQDRVLRPVRGVEGSFTNVMGLPVVASARLLAEAGIELCCQSDEVEAAFRRTGLPPHLAS